jgi:hypothetical protein
MKTKLGDLEFIYNHHETYRYDEGPRDLVVVLDVVRTVTLFSSIGKEKIAEVKISRRGVQNRLLINELPLEEMVDIISEFTLLKEEHIFDMRSNTDPAKPGVYGLSVGSTQFP